ncbi:hypothetical protein A2U01_0069535, partial [Trifolium medium]|nr:hypothetical protein [Trifolium medium]
FLPASCRLFFLDGTGLAVLGLKMDALLGYVIMGPVIPESLVRVLVRLGRYLLWELDPALPKFRGVALGQDMLARHSEGSV